MLEMCCSSARHAFRLSRGKKLGSLDASQVSGSNLYVARRGSSLHVCAAADRFNVARMLIEEAGADVDNAAGPQQSRPLHIAARCGLKGVCVRVRESLRAREAR